MSAVRAEDLERLANRLALMVSEDGEAENAGRAVGQLARRLGLTGGQLKAMFLAGAQASEPARGEAHEMSLLRKALAESEAQLLEAEQGRELSLRELARLRLSLREAHAVSRSRTAIAMVVVLVVIGAAAISAVVPLASLQSMLGVQTPLPAPAAGSYAGGTAVVRVNRAVVFARPDRSAPVIATLPAGVPVVVRRLVWGMLMQWAQIEVGSSIGYVLTSDINLS